MPKLGLTILAVIFTSSFKFSQVAAAAQSQPQTTRSTIINSRFANDRHSIALVSSKCTMRRYRRPH